MKNFAEEQEQSLVNGHLTFINYHLANPPWFE